MTELLDTADVNTILDVEPFDTHREIRYIRSWDNKDVLRCADCGATQTQTGVRLPDGRLDGPVTGTLGTVVCPAWRGAEQ